MQHVFDCSAMSALSSASESEDDIPSVKRRLAPPCPVFTIAGQCDNMKLWFPGLLTSCLHYLDLVSLLQCECVAKEWQHTVDDPAVWANVYCLTWRRGLPLPLPSPLHATKTSDPIPTPITTHDWKLICKQRMQMPLEASTRAKWWIHPGQTLHIHNQGLQRATGRVCIESARTEKPLAPLLLSCPPPSTTTTTTTTTTSRNQSRVRRASQSRQFDTGVCYFEAHVRGSGSVGLASVSTQAERLFYGFGSSYHVGWMPVSYGYHADDGQLFWNGNFMAYGPQWGRTLDGTTTTTTSHATTDTIGCGFDLVTGRLFFTKNGTFLGHAGRSVMLTREYAAAVSLHHLGDMAELNLGRAPFLFDIEGYIATRNDMAPGA